MSLELTASGERVLAGLSVAHSRELRRVAPLLHSLLSRLAGEVEVERALQIIAAGVEPLRELIGAIHSKLLLEELQRERERPKKAPKRRTS